MADVNITASSIALVAPAYTIVRHTQSGQKLVRERIMDKIGERLERITTENGFFSNIGQTVGYGKAMSSLPPIPSVNYYDDTDSQSQSQSYGVATRQLSVTFECFEQWTEEMGATPDSMERLAGRMLADVEIALFHDHRSPYAKETTFDGLAHGIEFEQSNIIISLPPYYWVGCICEWIVLYETIAGDPFHTVDELPNEEED